MKVKDLKPSGYNPRKIDAKRLEMLRKSMMEFGDLSGIVFNRRTGNLIGGHQRLKHLDPDWEINKKAAADEVGTVGEGYILTPSGRWVYREVDWPEEKEKAANLAANKHGGEWDLTPLKDILADLREGDQDLEIVGFDSSDLVSLYGDASDKGVPPPEPGLIPTKDPNVLVRLSFHPGIWLGKRQEIQNILKEMEKTYSCKISVDE